MYTIKEAAVRSGLNVPTLRAWERRYGVVEPERTPAGYRLYGDESIARLLAMHHLVRVEGWRPSQAAQRVLAPGADLIALGGSPAEDTRRSAPEPRSDVPRTTSESAAASFVQAAHGFDVAAMERVLDAAFAAQRFESAVSEVVFPALRAIGDAWATGEIDVAAEHAASETVRRRMARFFDAAGREDGAPQVVVGLPPAGRHELGALAFAVACRRIGLRVLYLGADVPVESWLATERDTSAPAVVLGVTTWPDVASAIAVIEAVRAMRPAPICAVGGSRASEISTAAGAVRLPESLDEGVVTLAGLLQPRQSRGR
jgi:methanogenic corrinoid protein MtbC1